MNRRNREGEIEGWRERETFEVDDGTDYLLRKSWRANRAHMQLLMRAVAVLLSDHRCGTAGLGESARPGTETQRSEDLHRLILPVPLTVNSHLNNQGPSNRLSTAHLNQTVPGQFAAAVSIQI